MQDAKLVEEQVVERTEKAEARTAEAEDHRQIAADRVVAAQTDLAKFQLLNEMFRVGQQVLGQRRTQWQEAEQSPPEAVFQGLQAAHEEFDKLIQQTTELAMRSEGALTALTAMEETLRERANQRVGQGRGIETAGERAVALASRTAEPEAVPEPEGAQEPEAAQESPEDPDAGFLDVLEEAGAAEAEEGDSAKEPIAPPKAKAAGKRSSRRKAE